MRVKLVILVDICVRNHCHSHLTAADEAFCFSQFQNICPSHHCCSFSVTMFVNFTSSPTLCVHCVQFQMATKYLDSQRSGDFSEVNSEHFPLLFVPFLRVSQPHTQFYVSLSASSTVPDGDDAFPASRQHWPSACGLVPVHLLWLLCQQSSARLPVQLPTRHRRVSRSHLWWVVPHRLCISNPFQNLLNWLLLK